MLIAVDYSVRKAAAVLKKSLSGTRLPERQWFRNEGVQL